MKAITWFLLCAIVSVIYIIIKATHYVTNTKIFTLLSFTDFFTSKILGPVLVVICYFVARKKLS